MYKKEIFRKLKKVLDDKKKMVYYEHVFEKKQGGCK